MCSRARVSQLIAFLAVIVAVSASIAGAQCQCQQTGITVSETATIDAKPDVAVVSLGVTTEDKDPNRAAQENARITTAVINAITGFGVARKDVETVRYNVEPLINYDAKPPVTIGYRVSNVVSVKQRDLTKVGQLIDVGIKAGANTVQGVSFTIEDPSPIRSRALVQAIAKAKAKAQLMADNLGVKLGKVMTASESAGFVPQPYPGPMYARAEAAPTPILPGDVTVTATVTVTYAIL